VGAADLGSYREFTIRASTADVSARTGATERDVTTLHERPALLQELSGRPRYASNALEALARKAQASAVVMDGREAPAREATRAKEQADAARAAAEKTRTANKDTFKP
jgi:hypothetical protein